MKAFKIVQVCFVPLATAIDVDKFFRIYSEDKSSALPSATHELSQTSMTPKQQLS
jgi:hypothetical protein